MSTKNQEKRDLKYNEWARKYPAVISMMFPLLISVFLYQKYTEDLNTVRYIVGVIISFGTIIPAVLFFYQLFIREVAIILVEKPLYCVLGRPCVNLIYGKWTVLSKQRRKRIKEKLKTKYRIYPPSHGKRGIKRVIYREIFELIREECRDNSVAFEYNCIYGFFRNLSGGLFMDLFFCLGLSYMNIRLQLGIESLLFVSMITIGTLLLLCIVFTYTSAVKYVKRVYVIFEQSKFDNC